MSLIKRLSLPFIVAALMAGCAANQSNLVELTPTPVSTTASTSVVASPTPTSTATPTATIPPTPTLTPTPEAANTQQPDRVPIEGVDAYVNTKDGYLYVAGKRTDVRWIAGRAGFYFQSIEQQTGNAIAFGRINDGINTDEFGQETVTINTVALAEPRDEELPIFDSSGNEVHKYQIKTLQVGVFDKASQKIKAVKVIVWGQELVGWPATGDITYRKGGYREDINSPEDPMDTVNRIKVGQFLRIQDLFGLTPEGYADGKTTFSGTTNYVNIVFQGTLFNLEPGSTNRVTIPNLEGMELIANGSNIPKMDFLGITNRILFLK